MTTHEIRSAPNLRANEAGAGQLAAYAPEQEHEMRLILIAAAELPDDTVEGCQQWCGGLADAAGESVQLVVATIDRVAAVRASLESGHGVQFTDVYDPAPSSDAPMNAAEFLWRADGRPDWAAMWTDFCALALYGGPPHRGEEEALHKPALTNALADQDATVIDELRRGIHETTGLEAERAEPGWIAVRCHSRKMAAWLTACIVLENVDARFDDMRLYLPADPEFSIADEVRSVITVLAKAHHYWEEHARV